MIPRPRAVTREWNDGGTGYSIAGAPRRSEGRKPTKACSFLALLLVVQLAAFAGFLLFPGEGRAIQSPRMSLDMVPAGNGYDAATNIMTVGPIDNCLSSDPPGNDAQHDHVAQLIIQQVEDLVGWQARLNYDGGRMRPASANFSPFPDSARRQDVSFTNLAIDAITGRHRNIVSAEGIPPAAAGPQTTLIGATNAGQQTAAITPDTPPKTPPDDTSYSAPSGGILAEIDLQVLPGQANQGLLSIDLDDDNPNPPGSRAVVFDGTGTSDINLGEDALFDGFHAEGSVCVPPVTIAPTLPPEGGGGQGSPGGPGGPGSSPGPSAGASPSGQRTLAPGETPTSTPTTSTPTASPGNGTRGNNENDGGTPTWLYVLIVLVAVGLPAAGVAAWRYRSRLPWCPGGS